MNNTKKQTENELKKLLELEYKPDKEKFATFIEFIKQNPNGNYQEFQEYLNKKETNQ